MQNSEFVRGLIGAVVLSLVLSGCKTVKTAPDNPPSTFTNPAPSLLTQHPSTNPTTVGEVK